MPKLEQIPKHDPERGVPILLQHVLAARRLLEHTWDDKTAFQGITLTPEDKIPRGQCAVSSVYLARQLTQAGATAFYTEGKIHLDGKTDDHVWVEVRGVAEHPLIADVTPDQYQNILGTTVHVGPYGEKPGVVYEPTEYCEPYDIPHKKLMARYVLLEQKISRLQRSGPQ